MGVDWNGFYIFCMEINYALVKDTDASKKPFNKSVSRFHIASKDER